jgi:Na+:H+ antiporter, NhaA family
MGALAAHVFKLGLPAGMRTIDLFVIGCVAAIGFTVSLFIASVAFDSSTMLHGAPVQDAAKMGALFSFAAAGISIIAGKLCRVQKQSY